MYNSFRDIHFLSFGEGHLRSACYKYSFLTNDIKKTKCVRDMLLGNLCCTDRIDILTKFV